MKKQAYINPATRVVKLQNQNHILINSVNSVDGGGLRYNGGGSGPARARYFDDWGDDDNWDDYE